MSQSLEKIIKQVCEENKNDRTRMVNIVEALQKTQGCVNSEAMNLIAKQLGVHRVEVESVVSFYAFLSKGKKGDIIIRVCNDVVDKMKGVEEVEKAFEEALGINIGETTKDGKFTLEHAPCIGMCDQAPAILVNDVFVTNLSSDKVGDIVSELKKNGDPQKLSKDFGDGNNAHELIRSMVSNGIKKAGTVLLAEYKSNSGLEVALSASPEDVIERVKDARLRGRGGAGFPTGMKWEFTRGAKGDQKTVICNADEGEPGTFKDRVLITEQTDMLFDGMTIAGYAIGATGGIIYLRGEYEYLKSFIESKLDERRQKNLLGDNILGKSGFNFDIRLQIGAGAYICGEETALISSCEGLRGDPKTRPPFPAQKGYMGTPTTVNNVETFCCVSRIMEKGSEWFAKQGSKGSTGTKLLSVSGDCTAAGIYELPFGTKIQDLLDEAGAKDTQAVLVGGPSGQFVNPDQFSKTICYDDVATGGSFVIFNKDRNILEHVHDYMEFFVEENCGYCTPCRAGNVLLKKCLEEILRGKGQPADIDYLVELGETVKFNSRCGLGQTSPNPILTTIKNFRPLYEQLVKEDNEGLVPEFDVKAALGNAEEAAGRESVIF